MPSAAQRPGEIPEPAFAARQFVVDPTDPKTLVTVPDPSTLTGALVSREIRALREVLEARLDGNDVAIVKLEAATSQRILQGVEQVRELYAEKFSAVTDTIKSLHNATDGRFAITVAQIKSLSDDLVARPSFVSAEIEKAIGHLRSLITSETRRIEDVADQRFMRIDVGLNERDKRADQLALANSAALAAALAAQKEAAAEAGKSAATAISKSELATAEVIKQLQILFQNGLLSLTNQVNDLKSRLDKGEGSRTVTDPATEARLNALSSGFAGLNTASDRRGGGDERQKDSTSIIFAVIGVVVAVSAIAVAIITNAMRH